MGLTINKKSTTTDQPPLNGQQPKPLGGSNAFYWYQIFAPDSAVAEAQEMFSSCFPCSPNQCLHHLNYIHIPCPELSCFTVTVFQNFRFECLVSTFLCEQTAKVDRSHYNNSLSHHKLIRNFNLFQPYNFFNSLTDFIHV